MIDSKIKISFVVPVYNTGKYLMYCLASLVRQTMKEIEIICVDDGSTDNSREIIEDFSLKDSRIKIILQEHKGTAEARNIGLKTAIGEYVHFVDSDDWICDNCAELTYNKAKKDNLDLVCFNVANYDDKTKLVLENQFFPPNFWPQNCENMVLTWRNYKSPFLANFSVANKLYKNEFLQKENIKFLEGIWFEDHPFHLESFLKATKIGVINRSLYFYRKNIEKSFMSTMKKDKRVFYIFDVFAELRKIIEKIKLYEDLKKSYFEYVIGLSLNMLLTSTAFYNKPKFYELMKELCKRIYEKEDECKVVSQSKIFITFMDVLKYSWFMFFLKYKTIDYRQRLLLKLERISKD